LFDKSNVKDTLWKKWVFCNWRCDYIFQLQWPLATHYRNAMLVVSYKLHWLQQCNSSYMVIVYGDKNTCDLMQFNANSLQLWHQNENFVATCYVRKQTSWHMVSFPIFIHPTWMKIIQVRLDDLAIDVGILPIKRQLIGN